MHIIQSYIKIKPGWTCLPCWQGCKVAQEKSSNLSNWKGASVYLTAVLEYFAVQILELAGNASKNAGFIRVTPRNILEAVKNDSYIRHVLNGTVVGAGFVPSLSEDKN